MAVIQQERILDDSEYNSFARLGQWVIKRGFGVRTVVHEEDQINASETALSCYQASQTPWYSADEYSLSTRTWIERRNRRGSRFWGRKIDIAILSLDERVYEAIPVFCKKSYRVDEVTNSCLLAITRERGYIFWIGQKFLGGWGRAASSHIGEIIKWKYM